LTTRARIRTLSLMADLIVEQLSKEYPTRSEPLKVLRDVSLELSHRDNVAVLGPSGSGKSTLLHVLGTLEPPTSGSVTLLGENPFQLSEPALAGFRNRNVGFIFQEHHLLPQLSVLENVLVPALAEGAVSGEVHQRALNLIERVGLSKRLDHRPGELSGGERQRVAVARALLNKPALLLGDEPTGSLDRSNARSIGQLLLELQQQEGNMLIVVTHSQELAAMFARRLELDEGRLCVADQK
jgi:lipoprotein-releasing system ATP-binding protein